MANSVVITRGSYGFGHEWTLKAFDKSFFLGQDGKFCRRVLRLDPSYIVEQIGSGEITEPEVNEKLADFIIEHLELTEESVAELQPWELCAQ